MREYNRKLYLVRHGETYNNIKGFAYEYDSDLTDLGVNQAVEISKFFSEDIQLIVHSGLKRTVRTASYTINRFPNAKILQWDVKEFNYLGDNDSMVSDRVKRKYNKDTFWSLADLHYKFNEKSESFYEFLRRIESFTFEVVNNDIDIMVVFSHKYFLKGILWSVMMRNKDNYFSVNDFYKFCNLYSINNADIIPCLINKKQIYFGKTNTIMT